MQKQFLIEKCALRAISNAYAVQWVEKMQAAMAQVWYMLTTDVSYSQSLKARNCRCLEIHTLLLKYFEPIVCS